ncbi:uncharacterized protein [Spinacia oleracea]|uniref:Uncharacterized protein isoform X3 n=1 Tax=Spinacia oleracea TaxID=3562 RepID=A0ABM3QKF8_SPIOL|nr:uncharacterized protein LOC110774804 isoform X3 [Spinacia oleracea]
MSYPGSQQHFGLSDLQLLQQQLMLARLQELQKRQQFGQLGDGKPSTSLNNMPLYGKPASGGQIPNLGSGTPFKASNMVSSSNLNWMHPNASSSMQGITRGSTYSHGEGLMMDPSLQQPNISFYGTPLASGRGNSGPYSSMQGVPHSSVYMLSVNSNEKPVSPVPEFANPFSGDNPSVSPGQGHSVDRSFLLRQGFQERGLVGQASAQTLNTGMSSQNFLHGKIDTHPKGYSRTGGHPSGSRFEQEQTKQTNDSRGTAILDPLEEKFLFDTEGSGWDTSFSKLAAIDTAEFVSTCHRESMNSFSSMQSGSWSALMQSAVAEASSSDAGIQEELSGLSFQNTDSSIGKQPSNLRAPSSSVGTMTFCKNADLSQGSRNSALSTSGMIRNDYEFVQQAVDSHNYMHVYDDTDQKDYKSMGHDHQSSSNPMAVDALYKRAAEIYGNQNRYQAENSCDSYNSKVSQADHACLNAEDSESSARSSHKSQNQALCVSSPGANSQQECFSHLKSSDAFPTHNDSLMKGKPKLPAEAFSKGSPASDMSASFESQNTSGHNKASQTRDHRSTMHVGFNISQAESQVLDIPKISVSQGGANPDKFSFQSSMPGDSSLGSLGNGQRGQTWWTPSSYGNSFPPLQRASLSQGCSGKNIFAKTTIETSNLKSESNSLEGLFSGPLHVSNRPDGKHISKVSETSVPIQRTFPEMTQQISLSDFLPTQDGYPLKNVSSFGHEYTASGASPVTQSTVIQGMYRQGVKPFNVWRDVPCQKNMIDMSSLVGVTSRSLAMVKDSPHEQKASITETADVLKGHESAEKYLSILTDASAYAESSINQQGYPNSGLVQKSSSGITLSTLPTYSQPELLHNMGNIKQQEKICDADFNKVDYNSSSLYNLNKYRITDFPGQQPLYEMHEQAKNTVGSQFDSCSSRHTITPSLSSGARSSMMEISSEPSSLQYVYPHKVPVFAQGYSNGNNIISDRVRHMQNEYMKNRQILSLYDSATLYSIKAPESLQLNGTITHVNGIPAGRKCSIVPGLVNQMVTCEQPLPSSVVPADANVSLDLSKIKKRKTTMYDCLPWHKEVMKTLQVLPDISTSEQEWAEVTNRLIEKCIDEGERNEWEMRPSIRAKRRLISTTKLMQLVFRPPSPTVLSVNASVEYEIVTYSITKLALADACSLANKTRTDYNIPHEFGNIVAARNKNGRIADCLSDKATELFKRTEELETHIDRLSKGISVADVLVECQELEKFCVTNHFARYHSRVPDPGASDSASSLTGVASVRPFLQRYVSAVPLPPKLPEGVQCLSL